MGALLSSLVFPGKGRTRSDLERACECAGYELRDGNALIAFSHPPPGCTPVLYSHGNAEDLVDCIGSRGNLKLVFYEYPGYGCLHEQERSEAACLRAAQLALSEVLVERAPLVLWGRSLGCALALRQAQSRPGAVRAVLLESPFVSAMGTVLSGRLSPLLPLLGFLDVFPVSALTLPKRWRGDCSLVIHGMADDVVPYENGEAVSKMLGIRILRVHGASHNNVLSRLSDLQKSQVSLCVDRPVQLF